MVSRESRVLSAPVSLKRVVQPIPRDSLRTDDLLTELRHETHPYQSEGLASDYDAPPPLSVATPKLPAECRRVGGPKTKASSTSTTHLGPHALTRQDENASPKREVLWRGSSTRAT